jgi:hypothetical protein
LKLYVTKRNVLLGLPSLLTSPIQESPDTPRFSQVSILSHSAVSKPLNPGISDSTESSGDKLSRERHSFMSQKLSRKTSLAYRSCFVL